MFSDSIRFFQPTPRRTRTVLAVIVALLAAARAGAQATPETSAVSTTAAAETPAAPAADAAAPTPPPPSVSSEIDNPATPPPARMVASQNAAAARSVDEIMEGSDFGRATPRPGTTLNLQSAIDLALQQNLGLNIQRYAPSLAADAVERARAGFDPVLSVGGEMTQGNAPVPGAITNESMNFDAGVTQRLSTGASVNLSNDVSRQYAAGGGPTSTNYDTAFGITVTQPLLRGFGETVNLAPIVLARASYQQSLLTLQRNSFDIMAQTEIAYWTLSGAYAFRKLRESNLIVADLLLRENEQRQRAGVANRFDVLQAAASLASRREEIIVAQQAVDDAEDRLRALLGLMEFNPNATLVVAELPDINPPVPVFNDVVQSSLTFDIDSQIQYIEIEKRRLETIVARNENRPNLDVALSAAAVGTNTDGFNSYTDALKAEGYSWSAGVEFSVPWGLREARAREREADKNLQTSALQMAVVQQELMLRVRAAWRAVAAGRERRVSTAAALALNQEAFNQSRIRYQAGLDSFRSVLEAQRDYDQAQLNHLQSSLELIRAIVALSRLDGTLLTRHGYEWRQIVPRAAPLIGNVPPPASPAPGTLPGPAVPLTFQTNATVPSSAILPSEAIPAKTPAGPPASNP